MKAKRGKSHFPATDRLEELEEEIAKGRLVEARLRDPNFHLDGLCDHGSQIIYIDPRPAIVLTLLHELCHRRWPSWSERRVERESSRLVAGMDHAEICKWFRLYQRAKRARRTTVQVDMEA